ncbi:hypothetical protein ACJX0J_042474, partial [Zea mays]
VSEVVKFSFQSKSSWTAPGHKQVFKQIYKIENLSVDFNGSKLLLVFSTLSNFAGHLTLKEDVFLFEIIGDQLTEWLSLSIILYSEMQQGQIIVHLENLWLKMVECLKRIARAVCRVATHGNTTLHPGRLIFEFDELLMHRRKARDSSRKTVITSNPTDLTVERYDGSVNVSVGLGRKRLKIMKYSTKPKELNKNRANMGISP